MKYSSTQTQKYDLSIQSHVWVWVLHICQKHAFTIIIMVWLKKKKVKDQSCNEKIRRSSEMANHLFDRYNILACHMVSICFKHNLTCQWQKCVYIHHQIILYLIVNMCGVVVRNVHGLIFKFQNYISTIKMLYQQ